MKRRVKVSNQLIIAAVFAGMSGGCSPEAENAEELPRVPISSQSAALTAQENAERALNGLLDSSTFLTESTSVAASLSSLGSSDSEVTSADLVEAHDGIRRGIDELLTKLRNEVFIEANLESDDGTHSVYAIPASMFCSSDDGDTVAEISTGALVPGQEPGPAQEPPTPVAPLAPTIDPECEQRYAVLQPRLRLSSPGEGDVDVDLLLTQNRHRPITFRLYDDRVGVVADLGELLATLRSAGEDTGNLLELDGQTALEIVRHDALDYSVQVSVLRDIEAILSNDGDRIELRLASRSPTVEVRLNGNARTLSGRLDYGAMNLVAPLAAFAGDPDPELGAPSKPYTGVIDVVLGGLNGGLTFDGNRDELQFIGLGLGDVSTTVMHDGNRLLTLDVNPDHGRRFDLRVESLDGESPRLTFSPTLDLRAALAFSHIADQFSDIPAPFLNDTLRLWFEGDSPSVTPSEGQLRVDSGTLRLTSASRPGDDLTVVAGMCLMEAPEPELEPASLPGAFTAAVCQ